MRIDNTPKLSNNYKILLLDDDIKFVTKKTEVLRKYGYNVVGEHEVKKALERLKTKEYDLLILDYLMDEMRGDKVVEVIRTFDKDLYILLLTGYAEAPALEIMNTLDITAYCEKSGNNTQLILLIKSALKSADMMKRVKKNRNDLNKVLQAVPKVYEIQTIEMMLTRILSELNLIISYSDAFIVINNKNGVEEKMFFSGMGMYLDGFETIKEDGRNCIELVNNTKSPVILEYGIYIPLLSTTYGNMGVMHIGGDSKIYDESMVELLKIYSSIAANSISNAYLHDVISIKDENIQKCCIDIVEALRLTIDAKDEYTCGHSSRVASFCVEIGNVLSLSEQDIKSLWNAAIFHDIGKIGIEDSILKKEGPLTKEEYEEIKKHPKQGALILSVLSMFEGIVPIVLNHHEKFDGSGYPNNVSGNDIPFLARILCVADSLDAMTTDRIYRKKKSMEEAVHELEKGSGTHFDPEIVKVTVKFINDNPTFDQKLLPNKSDII